MPTTEELLEQLEQEAFAMPDEQVYCVIDPDTRQISVPAEYQLLGVESDEKAERIWFQCPKIVGDNIDLSQLQIRVNYQNANSQKDQYIVTDVQAEGDNIVFSWLLSRKVTAYRGSVSFIVCAVRVSGETIQNEWNTTLATAQVLQGLEVEEPEITEEESDVIAQLLQIMTDTSEQAVSDVNVAKTNAISAITAQQVESVSAVQSAQSTAVQAVENAGKLIEESLPSDYTELSNKVDELDRTKAPAITESTSGESIQLSDSGDAPLMDIKLYGKSKQVTTTGAQLFNITDGSETKNGITVKRENGIITVTGTPISTTGVSTFAVGRAIFGAGTYTISVDNKFQGIGIVFTHKPNGILNLTMAETIAIKTGTLTGGSANDYISLNVDNTKGTLNYTVKFMFNAGSSALPWEPYTGGKASPSPDYPQEIEIPGSEGDVEIDAVKIDGNLLDFSGAKGGASAGVTATINNDGSYTLKGTPTGQNVNIWLKGGYSSSAPTLFKLQPGTYMVRGVILFSNGASLYDVVGNNVASFTIQNEREITGIRAVSLEAGTSYNLTLYPMLNSGSAILPYEPYKHTSATLPTPNGLPGIPVTSGGNYTDADGQQWVCDEIDFKREKYVQRVKKVVYDGSEDEIWSIQSTNIYGIVNFRIYMVNDGNENCLCSHLTRQSSVIANTQSEGFMVSEKTLLYFRIKQERAKDVADFKRMLAEDNIIMLHTLATPIETDLTTEQLTALKQLRTYQTVTNITTDSEPQVGMEVEYTADTKTYIDNKFAELAQSLAATQNTLLQEV